MRYTGVREQNPRTAFTYVKGDIIKAIEMLSGEEVSSKVFDLYDSIDGSFWLESSPQTQRLWIISVHSLLACVTIILRSCK